VSCVCCIRKRGFSTGVMAPDCSSQLPHTVAKKHLPIESNAAYLFHS
jgi:hypothetical protein